jgi:hypothetical protein
MPSLTSFSIIKIVYTEDRWDLMTICTVRKSSSKGKIVVVHRFGLVIFGSMLALG